MGAKSTLTDYPLGLAALLSNESSAKWNACKELARGWRLDLSRYAFHYIEAEQVANDGVIL